MMPAKVIAHVTDAHIGQKPQPEGGTRTGKMHYLDEPDEHKANLKIVLDDAIGRGVSELIFGGDIGTTAANRWFFELIENYNFKLRMVLGNHDSFLEVIRHYRNDLSFAGDEMNYASEDDSFRYIYLDSSANIITDTQLRWLTRNMSNLSNRKVALFVHHPILKIDTPLDKYGAALKGRDKVRWALHDSDCDISLFCGHYHMEDVAIEQKIRQFSTPAVSYQIDKKADTVSVDAGTFGYRLIELGASNIKTDVVWFEQGRG
jgi:3',5'-cyclic-AMP phosphodiesterase